MGGFKNNNFWISNSFIKLENCESPYLNSNLGAFHSRFYTNQFGYLCDIFSCKKVTDRPFSIMPVKLAFNATRNSRIKPKKNAKIMPDFFKKCHLNSKKCFVLFQTKRTNSCIICPYQQQFIIPPAYSFAFSYGKVTPDEQARWGKHEEC